MEVFFSTATTTRKSRFDIICAQTIPSTSKCEWASLSDLSMHGLSMQYISLLAPELVHSPRFASNLFAFRAKFCVDISTLVLDRILHYLRGMMPTGNHEVLAIASFFWRPSWFKYVRPKVSSQAFRMTRAREASIRTQSREHCKHEHQKTLDRSTTRLLGCSMTNHWIGHVINTHLPASCTLVHQASESSS
ncbi:hypothetical protein K461DRAFT_36491 [Myriangium duriaei CBS 260.36]|uniref:Uncharacterized protein n=1 Tax=Myriangium duriaei CBS 260.36 TaxID=1168546 RepID=A0A9P4IZZ4_9PEZI|nr:hypothetical protein K461DRAFT_36491 [Myriangium duriaei CBS 260.36]